jgi:myo-inositol 2-dehydrogenase / D-chiro-inositol 1-dehydrogenase
MASMPPVRVAVVGAGRMGRTHLAALADAGGIEVAAIVEPVDAVRAQLEGSGKRLFASVDELLEAGDVDAALIAAPTDLHRELVQCFAAARLPVLCEKPCGLSTEETKGAVTAATEAGILLQIGYWRRFVPALRVLRDRLAAGELGEVLAIGCWQWDAEPPAASFRERSGGILLDMGVHEFDQIRWLSGGELADVVAVGTGPVEGDLDSASALARLVPDGIASVSLGRMFPHGDCCWVEVMGTRGHARELFVWGEDGLSVFHHALVAQAEAFATAVRGGVQEGASGEDAVRAIEAAERATQSLVGGAPA